MTDQDRLRIMEERINTLNVKVDSQEKEINRGHTDLVNLHADRIKIFDKLEDGQKKMIENEKDITYSKEIFLSKIEDLKNEHSKESEKLRNDMDTLQKNFISFKDEFKIEMKNEFESLKVLFNEQVRSSDRGRRVWIAIAVASFLSGLVMILISKFGG